MLTTNIAGGTSPCLYCCCSLHTQKATTPRCCCCCTPMGESSSVCIFCRGRLPNERMLWRSSLGWKNCRRRVVLAPNETLIPTVCLEFHWFRCINFNSESDCTSLFDLLIWNITSFSEIFVTTLRSRLVFLSHWIDRFIFFLKALPFFGDSLQTCFPKNPFKG